MSEIQLEAVAEGPGAGGSGSARSDAGGSTVYRFASGKDGRVVMGRGGLTLGRTWFILGNGRIGREGVQAGQKGGNRPRSRRLKRRVRPGCGSMPVTTCVRIPALQT